MPRVRGTRFASATVMKPRSLKVSDLMSTAVLTIQASHLVSEASTDMRIAGVRHLIVVDDRQHMVGILSNRDLFAALSRQHGKGVRVADVMTARPRSIGADASARKAAAIMLEHKIGSLPVTGEDGQLVGIITESDFLQLAVDFLAD